MSDPAQLDPAAAPYVNPRRVARLRARAEARAAADEHGVEPSVHTLELTRQVPAATRDFENIRGSLVRNAPALGHVSFDGPFALTLAELEGFEPEPEPEPEPDRRWVPDLEDEEHPDRLDALDRVAWRVEVAEHTAPFRKRVKKHHAEVARRARDRGKLLAERAQQAAADGANLGVLTQLYDMSAAEWRRHQFHRVRAKAQLRRFERVEACGIGAMVTRCANRECRAEFVAVEARCRQPLFCLDCKLDYQSKYRAKVARAIEQMDADAQRDGLHWLPRRDRPRAKFLTLTPGGKSAHPDDDAKLITKAFPRFIRKVRAHLVHDRGWKVRHKNFAYLRRLEATVSGGGHMHFHCVVYLPFIPQALIAHWWGCALLEAGGTRQWEPVGRMGPRMLDRGPTDDTPLAVACSTDDAARMLEACAWTRRGEHGRPLETIERPVVDIRACRGDAAQVAAELCKYLLKDIEDGDLVAPRLYARLVEAFHGRRTIQATRGLMAEPEVEVEPHLCKDCGCRWTHRVFDDSRSVVLDAPVRGP